MMISIVTPTYNSEKYLEKCIQSIMNQEYQEYEHIIVDGGSQDRTLDILRLYENRYPMHWISEEDNGMYDAIAKGFHIAKGDILCWLNSDDIYMPWTLRVVSRVFQNKEINWCVGIPTQLDEKGNLYFATTKTVTFPQYVIKRGWMDGRRVGCVQQESSFWRRSLYESVGGINIDYKLAGDYALWRKFAQKEKLYSLNTILAAFRIHSGQKSGNRMAYCDEAHVLSSMQKTLMRLKFYRIMNYLLKCKQKILDIREITE